MSWCSKQGAIFGLICYLLFSGANRVIAQVADSSAQVSSEVRGLVNSDVSESVQSMAYGYFARGSTITHTSAPMETYTVMSSGRTNWSTQPSRSQSLLAERGMTSSLPGSRSRTLSGTVQSLKPSKDLKTLMARRSELYAPLLRESNGSLWIALRSVEMRQGTSFPQENFYTSDFPDSTEGTALVSPPDPGTQSPLEWSPELDFSFPDFSQETFLNPSLHVGRLSKKKKRRERAKNARNYAPSKQQPSMLGSFPQPDFEPDILKQPVAQSPLDSLLNPQ